MKEMMIASRHGNFPVKAEDKIAGTRIIPLVIEKEKMERAKPCLCFEDSLDLRKILRESEPERVAELLDKAFQEAVCMKPEQHRFEVLKDVTEQRKMVQIGG